MIILDAEAADLQWFWVQDGLHLHALQMLQQQIVCAAPPNEPSTYFCAGAIKGDHPAGWQDKHPRGNPVMQRMSGLP